MTFKDPEKQKAYQARYHAEYHRKRYDSKRRLLELYLGGVCVACGSAESLEFDHIDPDTKSFAIMAKWTQPISKLVDELDKCQLLCADCHRAKTIEGLSVEHGGGVSGKKNCDCGPCRDRKREYMQGYSSARI